MVFQLRFNNADKYNFTQFGTSGNKNSFYTSNG